MTRIQTILCPVDFSAPSEHALVYALHLAKALGARVHAFHVFEMSEYLVPESPVVRADLLPKQIESARANLTGLVEKHRAYGVPLTGSMKEGLARRLVLEAVKEQGADLVVMGSHGRSGLSRLLIGSVAERVVRTSPVPVLVVREPHEA